MKQITLRLPEGEWASVQKLVLDRVGMPMSDNYVARRLIEAGAESLAITAKEHARKCAVRSLKVRKGHL